MAQPHQAFVRAGLPQRGVLKCDDFEPLVLEGCVVDVQTTWFHARVNVRQEFKNTSSASVKCFAALPIPAGWTVAGFRYEIENHFAMGKITKFEVPPPVTTAKEPQLEVFTGNIPKTILAGQSTIVTATYYAPLDVVGTHAAALTIPQNISAGRIQQSNDATSAWKNAFVVPGLSRLTKSIMVNVKGQCYAANETAPSIAGAYADAAGKLYGDPRNFEIKFESREESLQLSENVKINFAMIRDEDPINVQLVQETGEGFDDADRFAVGTSVSPQFTNTHRAAPNTEVIFVIDCSGSMDGKLEEISRAVKIAAAGLPSSCFVNVVKFGAESVSLFPEGSKLVDAETLAELNIFVSRLVADQGETKIFHALHQIFETPFISGFARNIVLLSDGAEAKHTQRALELVRMNTHSTRVSTVAIGASADTVFLAELAVQSNGRHTAVAAANGAANALVELLTAVVVPTLADVAIVYSYDGSDEDVPIRKCHNRVPLVPEGERCFLHGIASNELRDVSISVGGNIGMEHTEYRVHSGDIKKTAEKNEGKVGDAHTVSLACVAAANARIRTLLDHNEKSCPSNDEVAEVIRLSLQFGILTPYTTFQCSDGHSNAIDPDAKMIAAKYQSELVRLQLPVAPVTRNAAGACINPDASYVPKVVTHSTKDFMGNIVNDMVDGFCKKPTIDDLLLSQNFDGSWDLSFKLANVVGKSTDEIQAGAGGGNITLWATAVAHTAISTRFDGADYKLAALASNKAAAYLAANDGTSLTNTAASFMSTQ